MEINLKFKRVFVYIHVLLSISACAGISSGLNFYKDGSKNSDSKNVLQSEQKIPLHSLKCSWVRNGEFIESIPDKVKSCRDDYLDLLVDNNDEKVLLGTKKYLNCMLSIIREFKVKFYSEKVNNFDLENLNKSVDGIERAYNEIYCRAFLCDESWKIIAKGDSIKIYEDFLKNIYNIIMVDMAGNEVTCQDKRKALIEEYERLID